MKIWAKTIQGEKITGSIVYVAETMENEEDLTVALQNICEQLDIPTPIVTNVNYRHFSQFNNTRFKPRDFVESVDFDLFDIEAIPEKKESK